MDIEKITIIELGSELNARSFSRSKPNDHIIAL